MLLNLLQMPPEQIIGDLPPSVREAVESKDPTAFQQALHALSLEEQNRVETALWVVQAKRAADEDEEETAPWFVEVQQVGDEAEKNNAKATAVLANFEPLLLGIAAVAAGNTTQRGEIEGLLVVLETQGWRLSKPVQRIWAGKRDETALTAGLDAQDTALVRRLLQILDEGTS